MKKLITLAIMSMASTSFAAATPVLSGLKEGKFTGSIKSAVSKAIDGKKGNLTVKKTADGTLATFVMEGSKGSEREEWLVSGDRLIQKEYDAAGKVVATYTATMSANKPANANEATFAINCADRAKNVCDNNIDSRNTWTLRTTGNDLTYEVWGVAKPEDKGNPAAQVVKRHEFSFRTAQ